MIRYLDSRIRADVLQKMVFICGPRQAGKTTFARQLFPGRDAYYNYDSAADRAVLKDRAWPRDVPIVVLDELHKMRGWKRWLKGVYDTEARPPNLLVTGSARLDIFRKGGDSMAGRFFSHRLHPLSVAELARFHNEAPTTSLPQLMRLGGFPEPYLRGEDEYTKRWRRSHLDTMLRQDLLDLEPVRDIKSVELLVDLIAERVGGLISYASLAEDLQVSPHTVKKWIGILEALFIVFVVTPYSRRIERSLLKQPKVYFFDTGRVRDDPGARFENAVACALYKETHYREDSFGERRALHYVRDKQKREVDFLTLNDNRVEWLIETKLSDTAPSPALQHFAAVLSPGNAVQLVFDAKRPTEYDGIRVAPAAGWLAQLEQPQ